MLKRGTKVSLYYNDRKHLVVRIEKLRGKLTLSEIEEILRYEQGPKDQDLNGYYALLLNTSESTCGGNGMWGAGVSDPPRDSVELIQLFDGMDCPVCGEMLPPFEYCPSCGNAWDTES